MLGMVLRTNQTGPEGKIVTRVLVENGCNIAKELYVSLLVDRATSKVALMASTEGGMDIEEVAAKTPRKFSQRSSIPWWGSPRSSAASSPSAWGLAESWSARR